jgi:hypothetical protein
MKIVITASIILYAVACCLPALEFKNSNSAPDIMFGLRALVVGWSGIFAGVFGWYANPLWVFALFFCLLRKPGFGAVFAVAALAIALTTFGVVGQELPGDEGNVTRTTVVALLPGFYVWLASLCVPLLAVVVRASR